ncbi:hypothetical protein L1049_002150 [Liquidambar formosana]|uniref:FAD-binding domain-containing protein n=1 Tax=Liquidambar formosana TaxID=63359 RepID=A0AAP0R977_LIQFO
MGMIEEEVVIVGAGIAGLATALALKRVGIRALVLEKADGLRTTGAALSLFPNAWLALDALGISHKLTSIYAATQKSCITNVGTGTSQEVSFGTNSSVPGGNGPRCVHRRALLEALAEELSEDTIRFSSKLSSIETQAQEGSSIAIIRLEDGAIIRAKVLIGCDGVHSVVARWLGFSKPIDSGRWAVRGLAVFPEGHGLKQEVHQFLDTGKKAAFLPLTEKEVYWFFAGQSTIKGEYMTSDPELIQRGVLENFAKDFPPSYKDIVCHSDLASLSWAPLMFRYPWDVIFGKVSKGNITVAGDAMHPMTPDLGQGGCAALEDAVVLGRHIGESCIQNGGLKPAEVARAIDGYVKARRWRAATLITGSFLSGWVQQDGSSWMKSFRDWIFYGLLFRRLFNAIHYDCGKLPSVSSSKLEGQSKID